MDTRKSNRIRDVFFVILQKQRYTTLYFCNRDY